MEIPKPQPPKAQPEQPKKPYVPRPFTQKPFANSEEFQKLRRKNNQKINPSSRRVR